MPVVRAPVYCQESMLAMSSESGRERERERVCGSQKDERGVSKPTDRGMILVRNKGAVVTEGEGEGFRVNQGTKREKEKERGRKRRVK